MTPMGGTSKSLKKSRKAATKLPAVLTSGDELFKGDFS
jgi:hypothetical protein